MPLHFSLRGKNLVDGEVGAELAKCPEEVSKLDLSYNRLTAAALQQIITFMENNTNVRRLQPLLSHVMSLQPTFAHLLYPGAGGVCRLQSVFLSRTVQGAG